jgi:hypothetical protein
LILLRDLKAWERAGYKQRKTEQKKEQQHHSQLYKIAKAHKGVVGNGRELVEFQTPVHGAWKAEKQQTPQQLQTYSQIIEIAEFWEDATGKVWDGVVAQIPVHRYMRETQDEQPPLDQHSQNEEAWDVDEVDGWNQVAVQMPAKKWGKSKPAEHNSSHANVTRTELRVCWGSQRRH